VKSTAPGLDKLPVDLVIQYSSEIAGVIAGRPILNVSHSTGEVRDNCLCALVTLVPNITRPQQFADFGPISVTPIIF